MAWAGSMDQLTTAPTLAYNPIVALINGLLPGDVKFANGPSPTPGATCSCGITT